MDAETQIKRFTMFHAPLLKAQRIYEMVIFTTGFGKLNFPAWENQIENPEMSKSAVE